MEEFLIKYYNLENVEIENLNDRMMIKNNNIIYYLFDSTDTEAIKKINLFIMNQLNNLCIIKNYFGNYITEVENHYYLLVKRINIEINIEFIMNPKILNKKIDLNWRNLWIERSNYEQRYYESVKGKYKLIDESIPYFFGLLELSIFYIKEFDNFNGSSYIQHKRIDDYEIQNPFNLKEDLKERDFGEYLKYLFLNKKYKYMDMNKIVRNSMNYYNFNLVIARLLYPNYYFDMIDNIINNTMNQNKLKKIIERIPEYEKYISNILEEASKYQRIKKILI